MAYYKPCKNCAVDKAGCLRRTEIATAISGLSVTVVNFRCAIRQPMFHSGQRVAFDWTSWVHGEEYDDDHGLGLIYHGTVVQESGLRFIVRIDDAPSADAEQIDARDTFKSNNLVIKVKPADMRPLNEPDAKLCPVCTAYPEEKSRCHGAGVPGSFDSYWPKDCARLQDARAEGQP